ncbi:MAG: prolipoprotein diacylglyceryl transferase family protein [Clostridia bacterium]
MQPAGTGKRYDFFPALIPGFALAHGIARIGCLLVGCCYGIEADIPFSITYHSSHIAPNDVPLLPVQAIEAAVEILIFCCPCILCRAYSEQGQYTVDIYTSVCTVRFCLEFLRGDEARGGLLMFCIAVDKYHTGCSRTGAYIYFGQAKQETGFQEAGK